MSEVRTLLDAGLAHHKAGRLSEADDLYNQARVLEPENTEVDHLSGLLAFQNGNAADAAGYFERVVAAEPANVKYLGNLGAAWLVSGRPEDALGVLERAIEIDPEGVDVLNNLAAAYRETDRFSDAAIVANRAVSLRPNDAELQTNLAVALLGTAQSDAALSAAQRAVELAPNSPEAQNALGSAYLALQQRKEAIGAFRAAVTAGPDFADATRNLALSLQEAKQLSEAAKTYQKATERWPEDAAAYAGLARTSRMMGRTDHAVEAYRMAISLSPGNRRYHSNLLFSLVGDANQDGESLLAEHRKWHEQHALPLEPAAPQYTNIRNPQRRLKIGYVSADFRSHPVGRIVQPVIAAHDRNVVEVFCYSGTAKPDGVTNETEESCDNWQPIQNLPDDAVFDLIGEDKIDILIDLSGHSARNRLTVFARKPAPIQASWMGYMSTTGLSAIDYYIGDEIHTPEEFDHHFSEEVYRLRRNLTCFDPPDDAPPVRPLPAESSESVTFGCFGNPGKISDACIELWARLLKTVEGSRLILRYQGYEDPEVRQDFAQRFSSAGIDPSRIDFEGSTAYRDVLDTYNRVDIALDTYPYSGTMTTMEALWMGVPLVTLAGDRTLVRQSAGQLSAAGLSECIAYDADRFVALATSLAQDIDALKTSRSSMRNRLLDSPLCDTVDLARALEEAYRSMWLNFLGKPT
ncbi:MAG: tetratricopeptide repeat protein [Alphaproteobacteria bacterium]|nr:tetratricopeptide repeat protein [Alphaproteobacteria bacterium]